jgi:hypothetical protein
MPRRPGGKVALEEAVEAMGPDKIEARVAKCDELVPNLPLVALAERRDRSAPLREIREPVKFGRRHARNRLSRPIATDV